MKLCEKACVARGFVEPYVIDVSTGRKFPFWIRHNTLSYASAEAMAAAFGGDASYIPSRMGFIYGQSNASPPDGPITRSQSWDSLLGELNQYGMDIQVVGFSCSPTMGPAPSGCDSSGSSPGMSDLGSEGDYCNISPSGSNAVTFHAVSNSSDPGKITGNPFSSGQKAFQAVLLGYHNGIYYVLSRVSLESGSGYLAKPSGFEVALDWTVVFR